MKMNRLPPFMVLLFASLIFAGCATKPGAKTHYTLRHDPATRSLQRVALLPVKIDLYELSPDGVEREVPDWSRSAEANIRAALLPPRGNEVSEGLDSSLLSPEERRALQEHLGLFNSVAANILWVSQPANSSWHFKVRDFDYSLGDGLGFLKTKYGMDAGLVILGEDVVTNTGSNRLVVSAALLKRLVGPPGHSGLVVGGLIDFETGDLLWMNHQAPSGGVDLRDPASALGLVRMLMQGYPDLNHSPSNGSPSED
jgi:hypothetical protein